MNYRKLGKSELKVSEIGFGCMSLGEDEATSKQLLYRAMDAGVNFFDTADLYDHGKNEVTVGKALKGMRDEVIIASKAGNRWQPDGESWTWDASPAYLQRALEASLKRLQTDYLDLFLLHGGTLEDDIPAITELFEDLQRQGFIRAYGISSIRPNVIREWLSQGELSAVMMQYSLLDRRPEEAMLDLLQENNVSVIARGPLAKGVLAADGADKVEKGFLDHSQELLQQVRGVLLARTPPGYSLGQLALRYGLEHPAVATVIPGSRTLAQLEDNLGAAQVHLDEETLAILRNLPTQTLYDKHR